MAHHGKRALLIGIDAYPRLESHQRLRGAVNDVHAMAEYLVQDLDFAEEDLRLLLDAQATRQGILEAFERLVGETRADDLVVVYYSGHGSRVRAASRGGDDWEETIVPYDSGRGQHPSYDVDSTELRRLLLRLTDKTRRLTLIFDCCHSGTLTRDPFAARTRWVPPAGERPPTHRDDGSPPAYLPYNRRYTLIAACRRSETAREFVPDGEKSVHRGVLTHHLLAELHRSPADATWRDVMEAVTVAVSARFRDQHPQLEGAVDRELFGLAERRPMRYVRVCGRDDERGRLVLDAGVVHGVGRGSGWAVYPPGTREVKQDTAALATLEVTAVRATTADAQAVDDEIDKVPVGARAVETRLGDAAAPFRVEVVAQVDPGHWLVGDLGEEIDAHPLLERSEGPAGAHVRIYLLAPRSTMADGDPVSSLGSIGEPVYGVVGADGELLMPARPLADPDAMSTLVQNLAGRARWLHALELRQRDAPTLEGALHFAVLRQRDGHWQPVSPDDPEFADGEPFAIEVSHHHSRPLHVYVLNFSVDGEISLVYPTEGAWEPIEPGHPVRYGDESGDTVRFVVPSGYPDGDRSAPVRAPEVLKLFATEESTDFRPLFQNRYRHLRAWRTVYQQSLLGQRLCQLLAGSRELVRREGGVSEPWITVERSVRIRRPVGTISGESPR